MLQLHSIDLFGSPYLNMCFCFGDEISPNFDLKNMISTYVKGFQCKIRPQFARFKKKRVSKHVAKNIKRLFFPLLSYLIHSQIWLNCLVDDCHYNYFTKLKKEKNPDLNPYDIHLINMSIIIKCMFTHPWPWLPWYKCSTNYIILGNVDIFTKKKKEKEKREYFRIF